MRNLVIIRHTESIENRHYSSGLSEKDLEMLNNNHSYSWILTKKGEAQMSSIKSWLETNLTFQFDVHLHSPYVRTKMLAHFLSPKVTWRENPLLSERDKGELSLLSFQEREKNFPKEAALYRDNPFYAKPPNGESFFRSGGRSVGKGCDVT